LISATDLGAWSRKFESIFIRVSLTRAGFLGRNACSGTAKAARDWGLKARRMTDGSQNRLAVVLALAAGIVVAAGCSQGGNAPSPPAPASSPPPSSGPAFTAGVFEPRENFEDQCEVVRTGVDLEGNPFPDMAGSTLLENFFLRSWTHETYLFNNEVVDRDPADFDDRLAYFAVLKTEAMTPSGKPKDEFHFSRSTEEFLEERNSAPSASYGAQLVAFSATPPRDFRVLFTEPGSPAAEIVTGAANLIRGTRILEVDGVDLVNAATQTEIDMINDGLFPANAGEQHDFLVQDPGGAPRAITMMSADLAEKPVNRTMVIDTPTGKVAYILLNTFSPFAAEADIVAAISAMRAAGVADLVVDLRYNGGGILAIASQLAYLAAGDARTKGKIFERLQFNADAGDINPVTGIASNPLPFIDESIGFSLSAGTPLESLDLPRVFVLTTGRTCSASESVINGLRGVGVEVILIGDTTCGKPFGFFPEDNCGETYFTIQFRGVNDIGFGDYADGFAPENSSAAFSVKIPGCLVADDLDHELGEEGEALLAAALQFRETGTCPTPPAEARITTSEVASGEAAAIRVPDRGVMQSNRDMRMPQ